MTCSKLFFILLLAFSFATSCRNTRQVVEKNTIQKERILKSEITFRDTVFFAPASQTSLKLPFKDCLKGFKKPQVFTQKNGNATVKLKVNTDTIVVTAKCDSLAIAAKIKQYYLKELNRIENDLNNLEVRTKGVSIFQTILYALSAFAIGLGVGVLLKTLKLI
ncbi:hypothetical protein [Pseudotamlana carrageenivorans]|uniref:Lipoprotein n=1 Tax=Pseudotamlana carrageenivorans TaxID=2069432 RepID=A0A2I7SKP3_9FLAO|nr:hypothetical protein [Tamlana carrageenivorans]AUS06478.1 hypothetical protein C1A40_13945 [Tamlana carrageenivorans]